MKRIWYAMQMFWITLTKRELFQPGLMKTVESIFKFLETTAKENRPMTCDLQMTAIASIDYGGNIETEQKTVLHLWCGIADCNTPIVRLRQLRDENRLLKEQIEKLKQQPPTP